MLRGFDFVGFLAELLDQFGIAAVTKDFAELSSVIVHQADAVHDHIVDPPGGTLVEETIIQWNLGLPCEDLRPAANSFAW